MQGFHAEGGEILVIVDEGAGVTEEMFEAIEGILTSPGARLLVLGNPTSVSGYFIKMFRNPTVHKIHIDAFITPNFLANGIQSVDDLRHFDWTKLQTPYLYALDPEWAHNAPMNWGEDSPMFQSRALGNFPERDANTLIPLKLLDLASTDERRDTIGLRRSLLANPRNGSKSLERRSHMRVGCKWPVLVAFALAAAGCSSSSSSSSCAAESIVVSPAEVHPGDHLVVSGEAFVDACDDTSDHVDVHPAADMAVTFTQNGQTTELHRVDAVGASGTFEVQVTVPISASAGVATVSVGPAPMSQQLATADLTVVDP